MAPHHRIPSLGSPGRYHLDLLVSAYHGSRRSRRALRPPLPLHTLTRLLRGPRRVAAKLNPYPKAFSYIRARLHQVDDIFARSTISARNSSSSPQVSPVHRTDREQRVS